MVGACQQNSGIFLVRGGGVGRDADGCRGWAGSGTSRDRGRRRENHRGWQRARSEMPAGVKAGLAAEPLGTG